MFESKINRGRANGYAPLDSGSKVPLSYLPPIQSTIDTGSLATTSSLNTISESIDSRVGGLENWSSSLGETFATDLEVSIVSSSVAATIGIVSQATGLATTGSNIFNGNQTITGSLSVTSTIVNDSVVVLTGSDLIIDSGSINVTGSIVVTDFIETTNIQGTGSLYLKPDVNDSRDFRIYNTDPSDIHLKGNAAYSFFGDDTNYLKIDDNNNEITLRANSTIILETGNGDIILNPDSGLYKGYADAGNVLITKGLLDSATGSLVTQTLFNDYTASVTMSANIDTASFVTTGSNTFVGDQTISGSIIFENGSHIEGPLGANGDIRLFSSQSNTYLYIHDIGTTLGHNSYYIGIQSNGIDFGGDIISNNNFLGNQNISGSVSITGSIYADNLDGLLSSSTQVLGGSGIYSSSAQLPSGLISGSSQLTASYDTRYTLSGSVVSGTTPAGTISGSSQLTSSFDGRYTQTGSFNTLTASFNSYTASGQAVTTGSNRFDGTQTITGSLNITNGNIIASQITANTASLYLTSGSNLYVQNNGVVEITGSLRVSGSTILNVPVLYVGTGSGVEGGEIDLAYAQTGSTLTGSAIVFDVYGDKIRIFENGGTNRGGYFDISTLGAGVGTDLGKVTYLLEAYANVSYTLPGSYTDDVCRYSVVSLNVNVPTSWFNTTSYTFTPLKAGYWEIIASYDVYRNGEASLLIKKNGTTVASAGAISSVAQQITKIIYLNGSTDYINVYNAGVQANARTQTSSNAFFQARYVGA